MAGATSTRDCTREQQSSCRLRPHSTHQHNRPNDFILARRRISWPGTGSATRAFDISAANFGLDHLDTLNAQANLAVSLYYTGRRSEAVAMMEQVATGFEQHLGPEHAEARSARSNLAMFYMSVGRTDEAVSILEQVVADRERLLGPDHADTLRARSNLASSYQAAGRTSEAITAEAGPRHPRTTSWARSPRYPQSPLQPGCLVSGGGAHRRGDRTPRASHRR